MRDLIILRCIEILTEDGELCANSPNYLAGLSDIDLLNEFEMYCRFIADGSPRISKHDVLDNGIYNNGK